MLVILVVKSSMNKHISAVHERKKYFNVAFVSIVALEKLT